MRRVLLCTVYLCELARCESWSLLLLGDLGDGAGRAGVLADTAADAGILIGHGSDVLKLQDALRAGVNANAAGDALVGINYRMSHDSFLSLMSGAKGDTRRCDSRQNITRLNAFAIPFGPLLHTVRRVSYGLLVKVQFTGELATIVSECLLVTSVVFVALRCVERQRQSCPRGASSRAFIAH